MKKQNNEYIITLKDGRKESRYAENEQDAIWTFFADRLMHTFGIFETDIEKVELKE